MQKYEIFTVQVSRTHAGNARVKERLAASKCVTCDTTTEKANDAGDSKHQCEKCRSRVRQMLAKLPPMKRAELLGELVSTGYQLMPQEIRALKKNDFLQQAFEHVSN